MEIDRLGSTPLHQLAYQQLCEGLMGGRFAPGEKISAQRVAVAFGMSTMPVREAMRRLAHQNILHILPKRAAVIPQLSPERILEIAKIRLSLEGLAAEMAVPFFNSQIDGELVGYADECGSAASQSNLEGYLHANFKFHFGIYRLANSEILLQMIEALWLLFGPYLRLWKVGNIGNGLGRHYDIVSAMRRSEMAATKALLESDIREGVTDLLAQLTSIRKPPIKRASDSAAFGRKRLSDETGLLPINER